MKYMLMMHSSRGAGDSETMNWLPEDFKAHLAFMHHLYRELTESGELVVAEGLASPGEAKLVIAGKGGLPTVTDGPFPENREFLRGFWIVEVDRPERAYEIAGQASAAPGPGGTAMMLPIEVRQVLSAPTVDA